MKRQLFEALTLPLKICFKKANVLTVNLLERLEPIHTTQLGSGKTLRFACPNQVSLWRAKTLLSKEPDTIAWINSFAENEVFYDIGANLGIFSLYGAAAQNCRVYAFEPESQNYAALNRNIFINQFQEQIYAYNFAISDVAKLDHLYLKEFTIGGALNNFGECVDFQKSPFIPSFKQAVAAFSLDDLIYTFHLPVPRYLKIDVDGLEPQVIAGAEHLLTAPQLQSILIELNTDLANNSAIIPLLENAGFELVSRYCSPVFANSAFKNIHNHIFNRV